MDVKYSEDGKTLIAVIGAEGKFVIPDGVTKIEGDYHKRVFFGCEGLKEVVIPKSVKEIGTWAFKDCTGLTSIEIPTSVESIGTGAFSGCTGLTNIKIPVSVSQIGIRSFEGCTGLQSVEVPDSVEVIGWLSFYGCTGLQKAVYNSHWFEKLPENYQGAYKIPKGIKTITSNAFCGCIGLTSIEIPGSVTRIGDRTFAGCTNLSSIEIPECVQLIGDEAFMDCKKITSIVIPSSVTDIGGGAFIGCTGVKEVHIHLNDPNMTWVENDLFGRKDLSEVTLYVPRGVEEEYRNHSYFSKFKEVIGE